jgi:hypothetical protein
MHIAKFMEVWIWKALIIMKLNVPQNQQIDMDKENMPHVHES